jgi:hypothetical protein
MPVAYTCNPRYLGGTVACACHSNIQLKIKIGRISVPGQPGKINKQDPPSQWKKAKHGESCLSFKLQQNMRLNLLNNQSKKSWRPGSSGTAPAARRETLSSSHSSTKKRKRSKALVAPSCNPSYLEG